MKNYFVYFRRLGNMKADIHCMKVEAEGIKEAKNKVTHVEYNVMHAYMSNKMYKEETNETYNVINKFLGDNNE